LPSTMQKHFLYSEWPGLIALGRVKLATRRAAL